MRKALAAAVVALVALGAGAFVMPRDTGTYEITAYFTKTIGLFGRSDVRVLGVNVGNVTEVTPVGERVKVTMRIEEDRKIPADATAIVVPISLISDRYIQLSPPYTGGDALRDGDVLDVEQTAIPAELDDLLISLKKFLDALETGSAEDPGALGDAIVNLSAALKDSGDDLDGTLGSLGTVSTVVNANAAELDSAVVSLSGLVEALSSRRDRIASLNTRLATALGALAEEQSSLDGALTNIAVLTDQLGSIVKAHRSTLEQDISTLSKTTQAVLRHQDSLVKANDWLHVLTDGAESSHNMGAVHKAGQSNNPGITHIDVRDAHYGLCPVPFIGCSLLPGGTLPAGAVPARSTGPAPAPGPGVDNKTADEPEGLLPSILPDPLKELPRLDPVAPVGPIAAGPQLIAAGPTRDGDGWTIAGMFAALGRWLDEVFGGSR